MQLTLAKTAGFCFGVDRAVGMAYDFADKKIPCKTLGLLIHNKDVTDDLESKGVSVIDEPSQAEKGENIIIRAHGISKSDYDVLQSRGAEICDATCPFVKKIHNIVMENSDEDTLVLIAGDSKHPEVIGIKGHCKGQTIIYSCADELEEILKSNPEYCQKRIIAVSQTTFSENEWKKCQEILKLYCTKLNLFDTICSATRKRQEEAELLSKSNDAMIVVGGRHSSNTVKLYNLCKENCESFLVERASELKNIDFSTYTRVGVTAGASTPAVIIKEVLLAMSEINENTNIEVEEVPSVAASVDSDFEAMLNDNFDDDSLVKCVVEAINTTEIKVSLPGTHRFGGLTGILSYEEFSNDPSIDPKKALKVGDELSLVIMKGNDAEGTVQLSKKRADAQKSWVDIVEAKEDGRVLEGTIISVIKGGVLASYQGSTVFIPASQATERRDDKLEELVKKTVQFRIIDVDTRRRRAVGSIRSVLNEAKKAVSEAFWAQVEEGKSYTGVVKSLTNYGAFVDIGGVDGMVHISEMSWKRIKHPSDVFEVGQEVEVFVKSLDKENKKISLGYRKDEDNPWAILAKDYPEGSVIEAEVVSLTNFGAFAKVIPGIDGLIHISQLADRRVEKPDEIVKVGEKVTCKITAIDFDKKRVSLSIRALIEPEAEDAEAEAEAEVEAEVEAEAEAEVEATEATEAEAAETAEAADAE